MKRMIMLMLFSFSIFLSILAVPGGLYKDTRGNQFLIDDHNVIHILDDQGRVTSRISIISEEKVGNSKGIFVTKDEYGVTRYNNSWWIEDGEIYVNIKNKLRTYKRVQ